MQEGACGSRGPLAGGVGLGVGGGGGGGGGPGCPANERCALSAVVQVPGLVRSRVVWWHGVFVFAVRSAAQGMVTAAL